MLDAMQFVVPSFMVQKVIFKNGVKEKTTHICSNALHWTTTFQKLLIWKLTWSNYLHNNANISPIKTIGSINSQGMKVKGDT